MGGGGWGWVVGGVVGGGWVGCFTDFRFENYSNVPRTGLLDHHGEGMSDVHMGFTFCLRQAHTQDA